MTRDSRKEIRGGGEEGKGGDGGGGKGGRRTLLEKPQRRAEESEMHPLFQPGNDLFTLSASKWREAFRNITGSLCLFAPSALSLHPERPYVTRAVPVRQSLGRRYIRDVGRQDGVRAQQGNSVSGAASKSPQPTARGYLSQ
uniref:Uncharacterized protein n=1 Tax=Vespula pensylvanica TaxID=30213 RepID=A0A834UDC7_VESPE|nr:hypothetical protein H0235_004836 [Vespula pensylvanica]